MAALIFMSFPICTSDAAESSGVTPRRPSPAQHAPSIVDNTYHVDWNNIDMLVTNHGSFAYDLQRGNPGFIYPRGSTKTAVFAAGPWIGAKVNGQVRVALGEYSQEFVPGPMVNGTFQTDSPRFKNYKIVYNNTTSEDYLNWPADQGAPVDSTGAPALLGQAMIWSVYNDADPAMHTNVSGSTQPLGIEVQQTTFAFNRPGPIANIIFVGYKLINKGGNTLDSMFVSSWSDPDLGFALDDLVGCDTTLSLGYVYNSTNNDAVYGARPPAVGFQFLRGPVISPGAPGALDTMGLTSFHKYIGGTDPQTSVETYNFMNGLNADGSRVINPLTSQATKFQVSGDPVTQTGWLDSYPTDRRLMLSTGPFTMAPGDSQEIMTAILVGQGTDRLSSISNLRIAAETAEQLYKGGFSLRPQTVSAVLLDARAEPGLVRLTWTSTASSNSSFSVFRRDATSDWVGIGVALGGAAGRIVYEDRSAIGGRSYAYRLLVRDAYEEYTTEEVWIDVPEALPKALRLDTPRPNPARGNVYFAYTLPSSGRVRIALHDASGRLAALIDDSVHEAGMNVTPLNLRDGAKHIPSGVYFAVLESGRERRVQKLVVAR